MKNQLGIWVDQKIAMLVSLKGATSELLKIESDINSRERVDGEGKKFGRFGDQYLSMETSKENKINEQTNRFIQNLLEQLNDADEIVIFGPSTLKIQLKDAILRNAGLKNKLIDVFALDKLTDNQFVATVKDFYVNRSFD